MNFSQRLGLFILILISCAYVYLSFFNKDFQPKTPVEPPVYNPLEVQTPKETEPQP